MPNNLAPALQLNFAKSKRLDPRITFSRASSATYIGADGLLKIAQAGEARFDHDPLTGACRGLLIEEARTNLLTYSQEFDNAAWLKTNSTVTANTSAAPSGGVEADTITITAGAGGIYTSATVVAGSAYTGSVFAAAGSNPLSALKLAFYDNTAAAFIATDVVPTEAETVNGMTRYWASVTAPAGCTSLRFYPCRSAAISSGTFVLWGAQLEAGAFPTSYIPTTSAAATRSADLATMSGVNFSSWYNPLEGTFAVDAAAGGSVTSDQSYLFGASDNGASNIIGVVWNGSLLSLSAAITATTSQLSGVAESNGASPRNAVRRVALAYKANDTSFGVAGGLIGSDASVNLPVVDRLFLGAGYNGANRWLNGHIASLAYFPVRLSNAELQGLTL